MDILHVKFQAYYVSPPALFPQLQQVTGLQRDFFIVHLAAGKRCDVLKPIQTTVRGLEIYYQPIDAYGLFLPDVLEG